MEYIFKLSRGDTGLYMVICTETQLCLSGTSDPREVAREIRNQAAIMLNMHSRLGTPCTVKLEYTSNERQLDDVIASLLYARTERDQRLAYCTTVRQFYIAGPDTPITSTNTFDYAMTRCVFCDTHGKTGDERNTSAPQTHPILILRPNNALFAQAK